MGKLKNDKKKLTLSFNKKIIAKAKKYAREHNISLSKMVENYFRLIVEKEKYKDEISPVIKELSGIIKEEPKKNYTDHLKEKYK